MSRGDYRGDAITITPKAWPAPADQALWATEDDYRSWNGEREPSSDASNHEQQPPTKRPRGGGAAASTSAAASRSKAIGKMFYKTKLCCKFRAGTCPYITNCNFAHGIEELRKPPPNWQEILAAQEDGPEIPREEHRIPIISSGAGGEAQRSYKGRHCKKFYTDEGCPYGDTCTFLHDEQSRSRESLAISLGPTGGSNGYGGGVGGGGGGGGYNQKLSNWKTRICNKWEMTGYCPFESKCQFAHGAAELHRFGGGLVDGEGRDSSSTPSDPRQAGILSRPPVDSTAYSSSVPHTDSYNMGISSQRGSSGGGGGSLRQVERERPLPRWKGPQKISRVYGDWIDDHE